MTTKAEENDVAHNAQHISMYKEIDCYHITIYIELIREKLCKNAETDPVQTDPVQSIKSFPLCFKLKVPEKKWDYA